MAENLREEGVEKPLSVVEIEKEIRENPDDVDLKEDLARALIDRYLGEEGADHAGKESDITRVREIVRALPESKAYYVRAYLAYLDENDTEAVRWLEKYGRGSDSSAPAQPFSADELYLDIIEPFTGASKTFWSELADSIERLWPGSPVALTFAAYVKQDEDKAEQAFDYYEGALKLDGGYWPAAWGIAEEHEIRKNWQAAFQYYERVLESNVARQIPLLCFKAAWCAGKVEEHAAEEKYYRACLELNPDYPSARNNLGWSLYKQRRYDEAMSVFDDCIARKVDGAFPRRNRARTLARLGRLSEAIDAWKQTGPGGRLSKHAQEQIAKLQARLNRGEAVPEYDEDGEDGTAENESGKGRGN